MLNFRHFLATVLSFILLATASNASAHTKFLSSKPAANAAAPSPSEITLTFDNAPTPVVATLKDATGKDVAALGSVRPDGTMLHYPLTRTLSPGQYTLSYRVTSSDAHVTTGTLTFTVTDGSAK